MNLELKDFLYIAAIALVPAIFILFPILNTRLMRYRRDSPRSGSFLVNIFDPITRWEFYAFVFLILAIVGLVKLWNTL